MQGGSAYSRVPLEDTGVAGARVVAGVPLAEGPTTSHASRSDPTTTASQDWRARLKEPVGNCCCCFSLRQGVIILASLNLLGGVLSWFASVGFGILLTHWEFVKQWLQEHKDPSEDEQDFEDMEHTLKTFGPFVAVFMVLVGIAQVIIGLIGLHGAVYRNAKSARWYYLVSVVGVAFAAARSLGDGPVGFLVNVGLSAYYAKVAWSWYIFLAQQEGAERGRVNLASPQYFPPPPPHDRDTNLAVGGYVAPSVV
mmetsp:Transcript_37587/g.55101  ORF Transcript_37587/g.55101 Transcript_37587/m.55101 type:complete len:253 (-) Transcript_37587:339-1097(-)